MKIGQRCEPGPGLPSWFHIIVKRFLSDYASLENLIKLTTSSIGLIKLSPRLFKEIDEKMDLKADKGARIPADVYLHAENMSTLAKEEMANGFPLIYGQAAVGLWAMLEATMLDVSAGWLYHNKELLKTDAISKLKIRLGEYEGLGGIERCEYIIEQLERDIGGAQKRGINRFESLLRLFYETGSLPPQINKYLYELNQVRNAILHRAYVADGPLVRECPWLNLRVGQKIMVTREMLSRYFGAAVLYIQWTCFWILKHRGVTDEKIILNVTQGAAQLDNMDEIVKRG
jgi:hypothetical protein